MNEYFDVFFHQQAIPFTEGAVLYQKNIEKILDTCEALYERSTGDFLSVYESDEISQKITSSAVKKHIEIQFFQAQLNWDVLLEELEILFPNFIWTKIEEEVEGSFSTYFCELIPISISEENSVQFTVSASLEQMGYPKNSSVSGILEEKLLSIFQEEEDEINDKVPAFREPLSFPVEVAIEEQAEEEDFEEEEEPSAIEQKEKTDNVKLIEEVEITAPVKTEESQVLFLKESLKREKASKERVRVAKEKLEYELLAIENSLLVSGLKRFKKHQKTTIDEEDWYKPVRIDLIHYDDLYKKAKFIEQSWRLNRQLVTITEKMTVTKDQWIYERARIEKIKNSVSEMDLQSMMEQCHLINERVRIRQGFLFLKPKVRLYQIDYEQLEKISAFFDIIQTENRLLESVIEQREFKE